MYVNVCSSHTGCGKLLRGTVHSWQNFYFDGHVRYRKRHHDDRRAKYSHKQTCYLPGVSPARIRTQIRLLGLLLRTSLWKTSPGGGWFIHFARKIMQNGGRLIRKLGISQVLRNELGDFAAVAEWSSKRQMQADRKKFSWWVVFHWVQQPDLYQ